MISCLLLSICNILYLLELIYQVIDVETLKDLQHLLLIDLIYGCTIALLTDCASSLIGGQTTLCRTKS